MEHLHEQWLRRFVRYARQLPEARHLSDLAWIKALAPLPKELAEQAMAQHHLDRERLLQAAAMQEDLGAKHELAQSTNRGRRTEDLLATLQATLAVLQASSRASFMGVYTEGKRPEDGDIIDVSFENGAFVVSSEKARTESLPNAAAVMQHFRLLLLGQAITSIELFTVEPAGHNLVLKSVTLFGAMGEGRQRLPEGQRLPLLRRLRAARTITRAALDPQYKPTQNRLRKELQQLVQQ